MNQTTQGYPYHPIPFIQVRIKDAFWSSRIETSCAVTIPYDFEKCESTGRIDNFAKAAGVMEGPYQGLHFNDSDVFKVIEGAAYALLIRQDAALEAYVDDVIEKIAAAQEDDGYLYTPRTIDPQNVPDHSGPERWSRLIYSHELYNMGHLYEAAVAYYQATGKRTLLDVALRNADMIAAVFGPHGRRDVPGHQEIEMGLVKLFHVTGDEKYLTLAKFFLDERGEPSGHTLYGAYAQDHIPVIEQQEAVGHAVRAVYMYAGMADVAALTGNQTYIDAMETLWDNVVSKKMALTGGLGALHQGEAFGANYELPNLTSYNETCAAIASIFWNHRLFLLTGQSKYIDILERTLYNGFLSGVSLDGKAFFYVNPLSSDGVYPFNSDHTLTRQEWFNCSCCPTNVVRLLPALSGYIYVVQQDALYVNLYMSNQGTVQIENNDVEITQDTNYPWDGRIKISIHAKTPTHFSLKLRWPGWAAGQPVPGDLYRYLNAEPQTLPTITLDGQAVEAVVSEGGYLTITRQWDGLHALEFEIPMPVQRVVSHANVEDLTGKVALERGPIVYTFEGIDHQGEVLEMTLDTDSPFEVRHDPSLLGGITTLTGTAKTGAGEAQTCVAIPYYAWGHRGIGEMSVWLNQG